MYSAVPFAVVVADPPWHICSAVLFVVAGAVLFAVAVAASLWYIYSAALFTVGALTE